MAHFHLKSLTILEREDFEKLPSYKQIEIEKVSLGKYDGGSR